MSAAAAGASSFRTQSSLTPSSSYSTYPSTTLIVQPSEYLTAVPRCVKLFMMLAVVLLICAIIVAISLTAVYLVNSLDVTYTSSYSLEKSERSEEISFNEELSYHGLIATGIVIVLSLIMLMGLVCYMGLCGVTIHKAKMVDRPISAMPMYYDGMPEDDKMGAKTSFMNRINNYWNDFQKQTR